ncbi:amidohydrolase family protein [Paraburkholderia lycopersici]|uniref:Predicted metal-dependent hydrolase, TIM-barrel fold n=1 Tax=Paraburkholderia lycopersici TaxID=416944 RepID=A0A1G6X9N5_9BURK|nr:amidohydrolase family protein [Paraburkholderia lycopersici]SDD74046.1 Predicted metal-dependent hydrolase, TIM-barrel fold [Paraburkholderia lycopersici]
MNQRTGCDMADIGFPMPPGACDCHTHVFPNDARFPFSPARKYTPPFAGVEELCALLERQGLERVVIVQPSVYGADNSATLHAVEAMGRRRARAVAVIDGDASSAQLDALHAAGVRGVRVNLEMLGESDPGRCGALLRHTARQIAGRGWHMQIYSRLEVVAALSSAIAALDVPVVLDHFARARAGEGLAQPGLEAIFRLMSEGRLYVKLSAPYLCMQSDADRTGLGAIARAFIAANADRVVWASNWPHPDASHHGKPDLTRINPPCAVNDGELLSLLGEWAPDPALRQRILVDNPARLYDFDDDLACANGVGNCGTSAAE